MQLDDLLPLLPHSENVDLDWKRTFPPGYFDREHANYHQARAELVKDVAAMANAASERPGHLVYGIADQQGQRVVHPVVRTETVDEAMLSQFFAKYLDPAPQFEYAEFPYEGQLVGMLRVYRTMPYPHVIRERLGGVIHKGQVYVRKGTTTDIALHADLVRMMDGGRPMVLPYGSPEADRVASNLQAEGWQTVWSTDHTRDQFVLDGYEHVHYPGTRRLIQGPTNNPPGWAQVMFLMRRRANAGEANPS